MAVIEIHQKAIAHHLDQYRAALPQTELYESLHYFLGLGGKRLRPVLCLLAAEAFGDDANKWIKPALAVEVFHNFTLIHDDIMDKASLRRGRETVHQKWDENTAILAGDAMLIEAYKLFVGLPPEKLIPVMEVFNATAIEVCEGQHMDMAFETRDTVSIEEYILMIKYKTSVLLGCSLKIGAILAGAGSEDQEYLYQFGINAGIAFQLQDDLLDAFPASGKFGKEIGGDIMANKKTYLLLRALQKATPTQKKELESLQAKSARRETKVARTLELFNDLAIPAETRELISLYYRNAENSLEKLSVSPRRKQDLRDFLSQLQRRKY